MFVEDDLVRIVVDGKIFLYSHSESIDSPKISSILVPGNIFGYNKLDNSNSTLYESWLRSSPVYD